MKDITKPHLKKFAKVKKIGEEPPLNKDGFWPKPKQPDFKMGKDGKRLR